jgi:hypothetical protein
MTHFDDSSEQTLVRVLDSLAGAGAAAARPDALLGTVRRRVRRRRAVKQAGVGVTTLAVGGLFAVGGTILQRSPDAGPGTAGSPSATTPSATTPAPGATQPSPTTPGVTCSAAGAAGSADAVSGGTLADDATVPQPVRDTAQELLDAAERCDAGALVALAEANDTSLTFGGRSAAEFWTLPGAEADEPVYAILAGLLRDTQWAVVDGGTLVWPRVFASQWADDDDAWSEAVAAGGVTAELATTMRDAGVGYQGWRVGIAADGSWQFFVGGD